MKKYRKALVAVAGVLAMLGKVLADGQLDAAELPELFIAIAVAAGVYQIPNQVPPNG